MKKIVFSMLAVFGIALGASGASAQYFGAFTASATPSTVAPGGSVTVTVENCDDGTSVTITLEGSSVTVTCSSATPLVQGFRAPSQTPTPGTASGAVNAPTTPGSYTGTASGTSNGSPASADFSVTVAAATTTTPATGGGGGTGTATGGTGTGLPATGGGVEPLAIAAIALLAVGGGLIVVTQIRRRQDAVTS